MTELDFIKMVEDGVAKVLAQGEPSMDEHADCCYLNDKGLCCVVGHMMPDDKTRRLADSRQNGSNILSLYDWNEFIWTDQFAEKQIQLLSDLQNVHDCWIDIEFVTKEFNKVINTYKKVNNL